MEERATSLWGWWTQLLISFLNGELFNKHVNELSSRVPHFLKPIHGNSGNTLNTQGQVGIPCLIGNHQLPHNRLLANLIDLAIVGMDYIDQYKVTWDW